MATVRTSRVVHANLSLTTVCPFLYQTRTIRSSRRHQSSSSTLSKPQDDENTLTFLQRKGRDVEARQKSLESTITPAERAIFENIMKRFGARVDLPQDASMVDSASQDSRALSEEDHSEVPRVPKKPISTHPTDTDIDTILSLFAPAQASGSFSTFSSAEEAHENDDDAPLQRIPHPPNLVRQVARDSLQSIAESLQTALGSTSSPPDLAIWRVLEDEIFPLITLLRSNHSPLTSNPYQRSLASFADTEGVPHSISSAAPETPILPLVTILYPAATLLAFRTYIAHLPASGFARALLPKIRSLGPASYLLAANTHLFNAVLHLQWTVYSDLRAVYLLLAEMRRNGVEYDPNTLRILDDIKAQRQEDIESDTEVKGGRGYEWWNMKKQDDGWKRLTRKSRWEVLKQLNDSGQLSQEGKDELVQLRLRQKALAQTEVDQEIR